VVLVVLVLDSAASGGADAGAGTGLLPLMPQLLVAQRIVIHSTSLASNQLTSGICK
jgi:predicted RNA methylase